LRGQDDIAKRQHLRITAPSLDPLSQLGPFNAVHSAPPRSPENTGSWFTFGEALGKQFVSLVF
jgi:hypothetical protein